MRYLLVIFPVAFFACSFMKGQSSKNLNCIVLQQIIEAPIFNKEFSFTENLNEEFILVDTSNVFSECSINTIKERRVIITNRMPSKKEMINNGNIIIVSISRKKECFFTFGFSSYATGHSLAVHYETEGNEYRLLGYRVGDF